MVVFGAEKNPEFSLYFPASARAMKAEFLQPFRPLRCPETSPGPPSMEHGPMEGSAAEWGGLRIWELQPVKKKNDFG